MKVFESSLRDMKFGKDVVVVEPANMYECQIGNNCFVGSFVEIPKGVIIGNNSENTISFFYLYILLV